MQNTSPESRKDRWLDGGRSVTCPRCCCREPARAGRHGGLKSRLQVEEVALHLHCTAEEKGMSLEIKTTLPFNNQIYVTNLFQPD